MKPLLPLFLFLALLLTVGAAGAPALKTDRYQTGPGEDDYGYRRAVRVGNTLHVSGTVGKGEMADAIRQAYGNIAKTLAHFGLGFGHVVKETIYTTKLDALKEHRAVRKEYYGKEFPAATWVQVDRLFNPEYVIEVEVTAVFPEPSS